MNNINLYEYVKHWQLLKNLEKANPFDIIIYENRLEREIPQNLNIKTLEEIWFEFWYSWTLKGISQKYKNILLILDELSYIYFLPFIKTIKDEKITIINLSSGISWFLNKQSPDIEDIWILKNFDLEIYEAYDFVNFFDILKEEKNKYIRIADKEIPQNIVQGNENISLSKTWELVSLIEFGITGFSGTILVGWYLLQETLLAIGNKAEENFSYDMFVIYNYNFEIKEELLSSIQKTEKLYIIIDHKENTNLENFIKSKLREKGIIDTEIVFIYPEIEKIQTLLKEHLFQEACFDGNAIAERL